MARPARQTQIERSPASRNLRLVHSYDGGPPSPQERVRANGGRIAVLLLIASETVMFAALIVAYEVLRAGQSAWPPADLPRLPIEITWLNTCVLLSSAFCLWYAERAIRRGNLPLLRQSLAATAVLGAIFLFIQGSEWVRLIQSGLTLSSGIYGGTFFVLIGLHAVHVAVAVGWLAIVWRAASRHAYSREQHTGVTVFSMYWYFVCAVWMVLFPVVYLR